MTKISKYTIHEPIWDGGTKERAIGIAEFRLPCIVDIDHKNSEGKKTFPHKYMISTEFAKQFRTQIVNNDIRLRIIPVSRLEEVKYEHES